MVQNRGINISIISQFDIRRLPEFESPPSIITNRSNTVDCFVPIYPGSQIWFEYIIEPPHPPKAAYFFKLLINGRAVTSWDCTEKHGYHGKMIYILEKVDAHRYYSGPLIHRRGLKFCNDDNYIAYENGYGDCIEIRVHRIEHRRRIHNDFPELDMSLHDHCSGQLQLISGGILEPGRPQKRYRYQLVDPKDEPYAIFRFFYRTYEYLRQHDTIAAAPASPDPSSASPISWHDARTGSEQDRMDTREEAGNLEIDREGQEGGCLWDLPRRSRGEIVFPRRSSPTASRRYSINTYLPLSDSDESLSVVARDSIEDLSTTVTHSPESPRSRRLSGKYPAQDPGSPVKLSPSPRQKLKKKLALDLNGSSFNMDRVKRPLSPFTSSGLLRRIISPEPNPPAPASATEFGLPGSEQGTGPFGLKRADSRHAESGGRSLMEFLGRRSSKREREPRENQE